MTLHLVNASERRRGGTSFASLPQGKHHVVWSQLMLPLIQM